MRKLFTPTLPSVVVVKSDKPVPSPPIKIRCENCFQYFDPKNNSECHFHPRSPIIELRVYNEYDEIKYKCCGAIQKGFDPILVEAPGCATNNFHISSSNR